MADKDAEDKLSAPEAASRGLNRGGHARRHLSLVKGLQPRFSQFSDEELEQLRLLTAGTHLAAGETYVRLTVVETFEFQADGSETVPEDGIYLAKKDISSEVWSRLVDRTDSVRPKVSDESFAE